ncbi:MAG: 23S rRNA (uracil(1939)-C(5))-methyltransferase RlmD [Saprospiraceae bacterium]|nr:23S rRNA (uracil(1939)-C(5))-methyltransferase RlmD [Saprospiraceae bacterium]
MARKKKIVENVLIHGIADRGKAVGRDAEGKVYFVDKAVPGDIVDVLVLRKKKSFSQGIVKQYRQYSADRVDPLCQHFGSCGGCKWQNLSYDIQVKHKHQTVVNAMTRLAKLSEDKILPIVPCKEIFYYRNKLEYSFSNKRWLTPEEIASGEDFPMEKALGFHAPGSFDKVVTIDTCHLQEGTTNKIRNYIRSIAEELKLSFYDAREHQGFFRNMIFRNNRKGEWMVTMIFGENNTELIEDILNRLISTFPEITSLYYIINTKKNDSFFDLDPISFFGEDHLKEHLGPINYKIGPKSFFQTNTKQAEVLYNLVLEFSALQGNENVYDLYTGIGSIALFLAHACAKVVGIEEVTSAIEDAESNKLLNNISNAVFYAGDVKDILTDEFRDVHGRPDLVVTDPPRAGMHPKVVQYLLDLESPKIVYVSCNPATQARDLALLSEKYAVKKVQPVDMFPHTHHIESIALLEIESEF